MIFHRCFVLLSHSYQIIVCFSSLFIHSNVDLDCMGSGGLLLKAALVTSVVDTVFFIEGCGIRHWILSSGLLPHVMKYVHCAKILLHRKRWEHFWAGWSSMVTTLKHFWIGWSSVVTTLKHFLWQQFVMIFLLSWGSHKNGGWYPPSKPQSQALGKFSLTVISLISLVCQAVVTSCF